MHVVLYSFAALLALIGLAEALPGVFQWLTYIGVRVVTLGLATEYDSMEKLASRSGFPAFFYSMHGMPAAFASPLFLAAAGMAAWLGSMAKEAGERSRAEALRSERLALAEADQRKVEVARRETEKKRQVDHLKALLEASTSLAHSMPGHMERATAAVETAEREFQDGLLDPFLGRRRGCSDGAC